MHIQPPTTQRVEASRSQRTVLWLFMLAFLVFTGLFLVHFLGFDPKVKWMVCFDILEVSFVFFCVLGSGIIQLMRYPVYLGFDERSLYLKHRRGIEVVPLTELDWFTCESVPQPPKQYNNRLLRALFTPVMGKQIMNTPRYLKPRVIRAFSHKGTVRELTRTIPLEQARKLALKFVPPEKILSNEEVRTLRMRNLRYYLTGHFRRPEAVIIYLCFLAFTFAAIVLSRIR